MKKLIIALFLVLSLAGESEAQCAMCRTTLENNISQGNPGIAAGINFGILYLLFTPYLAIALIAFFWYRASRLPAGQAGKNSIKVDESSLAG
jgi:hypothetical protein